MRGLMSLFDRLTYGAAFFQADWMVLISCGVICLDDQFQGVTRGHRR